MLNGDDNIMKMASRLIDLISKKQIARAEHFFF